MKRLRDAIDGDDDEVLDEFERRHFFRGESEPLELVRMREEWSSAVYEAMWGLNEWTDDRRARGLGRPSATG